LSEHKGAASVAFRSGAFRAAYGNTLPNLPRIRSGGIFDLPSNPSQLNPQRMLLDLGYRQDFALLLFGDLKGIGTSDALTLSMDGQGQVQSIYRRYMKYLLQDEFDKIHGCVIVVIEDDVPHTRTFYLCLIFLKEIEFRYIDDRGIDRPIPRG